VAILLTIIFTVLIFYASNPVSSEFLLGLIAFDGLLIAGTVGLIQIGAVPLDQLAAKAEESRVTEALEKWIQKYLPGPSRPLTKLLYYPSVALTFSVLFYLFIAAVLALAALSHMVPNASFWQAPLPLTLTIISFALTSWSFLRCLLHLASTVSSSRQNSRK
jgi:uncharacterized integral membrane protein